MLIVQVAHFTCSQGHVSAIDTVCRCVMIKGIYYGKRNLHLFVFFQISKNILDIWKRICDIWNTGT